MDSLAPQTILTLLTLARQAVEYGNGRIRMSRAWMRDRGFWNPDSIDCARRELTNAGLLAMHKRGVPGACHLYRLTWLPLPKESA
jgi:hypothetical protein